MLFWQNLVIAVHKIKLFFGWQKRVVYVKSHHLCSQCDTIHKVKYIGIVLKETPRGWLYFPLNTVVCEYCGAEVDVVTLHTDETGRLIQMKYERVVGHTLEA
jgi:hypothetical protein